MLFKYNLFWRIQHMPKTIRTTKSILLSAVFTGVIGFPILDLQGREFELGLKALNKGEYNKAFPIIKFSAERGNVKSQFLLSTLYRQGLGVKIDEFEGFHWCKLAAEEGHLEAQFQLGLMYLEGEGVTDDETEAQIWLWRAADRGYPQAIEVLTYIFSEDYQEESEIGC